MSPMAPDGTPLPIDSTVKEEVAAQPVENSLELATEPQALAAAMPALSTPLSFPSKIGWRVLRPIVQVMLMIFGRLDIKGREHVPRSGPVLIISNHLSWMDPLVIYSAIPRQVRFMAKVEMFNWFFIGGLARFVGCFPIRRGMRDRRAVQEAIGFLKQGETIGIFPEGTYPEIPGLLQAHPGVVLVALRAGANILPVGLAGTERLIRKHTWYRRPRVQVRIGIPYRLERGKAAKKEDLTTLTADLMRHIAALVPPEYRGYYSE